MLPGHTGAMEPDEIKAGAARLSSWAHLATVGADGKPDVAPIHPAWEGDTFTNAVKVKPGGGEHLD